MGVERFEAKELPDGIWGVYDLTRNIFLSYSTTSNADYNERCCKLVVSLLNYNTSLVNLVGL